LKLEPVVLEALANIEADPVLSAWPCVVLAKTVHGWVVPPKLALMHETDVWPEAIMI
jgi:hypothetical protein